MSAPHGGHTKNVIGVDNPYFYDLDVSLTAAGVPDNCVVSLIMDQLAYAKDIGREALVQELVEVGLGMQAVALLTEERVPYFPVENGVSINFLGEWVKKRYDLQLVVYNPPASDYLRAT